MEPSQDQQSAPKDKLIAGALTLHFRERELRQEDFSNRSADIRSVIVEKCSSNDWPKILHAIGQLPLLDELIVVDCGLKSDDIECFKEFKVPLRRLVLDGNHIAYEAYQNLLELSSLEHLSIVRNPINETDGSLPLFVLATILPNIKEIVMPLPGVTRLGDGPHKISWNLLNGCRAMMLASNLPQVEKLCLGSCSLNEQDLSTFLRSFKRLNWLNTDTNSFITVEGWARLSQSLPIVKELSVERCQINEQKIVAMGRGFTSLRVLHLAYNRLSSGAMTAIVKLFPQLEELDISNNRFGSKGVQPLAIGLPHLTTLKMEQCQVGPDGLIAMLDGLPRLSALNINYNRMTPEVMRTIVSRLKHLQYLDAEKTSLNDEMAVQLGRILPKVLGVSMLRNRLRSGPSFLRMKVVLPLAYISV